MSDLSKLVKPLEWRECGDVDGVPEWKANSLIGQYSVRYVIPLTAYHVYGGWVSPLPSRYRDDDLAKAAAQADYTARIIAALDPEALAKIRADALREAAAKAKEIADQYVGYMSRIEKAILALIDREDQA
jgi:hypothetical protein